MENGVIEWDNRLRVVAKLALFDLVLQPRDDEVYDCLLLFVHQVVLFCRVVLVLHLPLVIKKLKKRQNAYLEEDVGEGDVRAGGDASIVVFNFRSRVIRVPASLVAFWRYN